MLPLQLAVHVSTASSLERHNPSQKLTQGKVQVIGYCARAVCEDRTNQLAPYIVASLSILVAPTLFAASIYMALGRLIRSVHSEHHSVIPLRWLTKTFVAGDVFSFFIQGNGGSMMAVKSIGMKTGEKVVVAGLLVQIIIFGFFCYVTFSWHMNLRREPTRASQGSKTKWKSVVRMIYITSGLIMVRSVFRVIEYAMGRSAYLLRHEWPAYVFDASLMVCTMLLYSIYYPGSLVPSRVLSLLEDEPERQSYALSP